jgi:hypothetical protein
VKLETKLKNMSKTAELPLTAIPGVEIVLSEDQISKFADVIQLLRVHPGSQCFFVLASSYEPEHRKGILRLQGKWVGHKTSRKVVNLIRSPESHE